MAPCLRKLRWIPFFIVSFTVFSADLLAVDEERKQTFSDPVEYIDLWNGERSPYKAALWGIFPGAGQIYLGNYTAGVTQSLLFLSTLGMTGHYVRKNDYIPYEDRTISFDLMDSYFAQMLIDTGYTYYDIPIFTETPAHRLVRMWKEKKLAELNPLLEYGEYSRLNYTSSNADLASQTMMHVMFYSIYSAYRDGKGARAANPNETFFDLMSAPFRPKYFLDPFVLSPLLLLAGAAAASPHSNWGRILTSPGMKQSGHLAFYTFATSLNAGVGEEAFFRGFMNDSLAHSFRDSVIPGPVLAALVSGTLFGAAHLGSYDNVLPQTLMGYYLAFLQHRNGYDIRPGIALHFWWDMIIFGFEYMAYKEDRNVDRGQREVYLMPTLFQFRF